MLEGIIGKGFEHIRPILTNVLHCQLAINNTFREVIKCGLDSGLDE